MENLVRRAQSGGPATMKILRYGHDTYGERVVNGASWDLLPVAFWAGVAVIVVHLVSASRCTGRGPARRGGG